MDLKDIRELIKMVDKSSVTELEFEDDDVSIRIAKNSDVQVVSAPQQVAPMVAPAVPEQASLSGTSSEKVGDNGNYIEIKSPMVGTFYASPAPDADPFIKKGDHISEGNVLCIIEAMKIMNELQSEFSGKVHKVLVKNGEPVEFNQTLFLLES